MFRSSRILFVCTTLLVSFFCIQSSTAIAQTPVDKLVTVMPDGVIGFYATSGGDSLKPAFEKSILGRIRNDPNVQTFLSSIRKQLITKLAQETADPNSSKAVDIVQNFSRLVLARPIIAGVAQKQTKEGPPVFGFVILDAGPRKDEIASALRTLESLIGEGDIVDITIGSLTMRGPKGSDVPVCWGWADNYLVLAINDGEGLAMKYLQGDGRQAVNYLQKVPAAGDALAVFVDYEKIFGLFNMIANMKGDSEEFAIVDKVIKELGISDIKSLAARIGFDGPDLVSNCLVEAAQPARGLLAAFKPIKISMFDMVDERAVNATAFNCDFAGIYDMIMQTVKTASPNDVYLEVQQAITEFETETQIEIRKGILESLAGPMISYTIPMGTITEIPNGGIVMIAGLKDASLWEKSIGAIEKMAAEKSEGMVQVSSQQQDGRTIHTWGIAPLMMAQVMPCWTVVGDKLLITSNLPLCNLAAAQISSGTKSIRGTEGFKKVTAKLPDNITSFRYGDTKIEFNQLMMGLQQVWPMATMFAAKEGLTLPFVLPNLSYIIKDLGPSCKYSYSDSDGYRSCYRGSGIEVSMGAIAGGALGVGIMMPALARTRQISKRMVSGTNLSAIGKAMLIYANDYDDQFPPNLQELVEKEELDPRALESKRKPKNFDGPSYIYVTGQNTSMDPRNILVYENPEYCTEGLNVLYMDSHVGWTKPDEFMQELKATYERLGREMPEIKFKD